MRIGLIGWTVKAFEGDSFSTMLKADISMNDTVLKKVKVKVKVQRVTEANDATIIKKVTSPR